MSIDGNFAIAAGCLENVYIFEYNKTNDAWDKSIQLIPNDIVICENECSGYPSIDIKDNVAIMGVSGNERVYIFEYNSTSQAWNETTTLTVTDSSDANEFAQDIAISLDTTGGIIVVGAPYDSDNGEDSGSVHIFERKENKNNNSNTNNNINNNSEWEKVLKFSASNGGIDCLFSGSVDTVKNSNDKSNSVDPTYQTKKLCDVYCELRSRTILLSWLC